MIEEIQKVALSFHSATDYDQEEFADLARQLRDRLLEIDAEQKLFESLSAEQFVKRFVGNS